jgi:hypothetical protein
MMSRPDPPPSKTAYPTWWSWHQARRAWVKRHGGPLWSVLLIAVVIGLLSGNAYVLLILVAVAFAGAAYRHSR